MGTVSHFPHLHVQLRVARCLQLSLDLPGPVLLGSGLLHCLAESTVAEVKGSRALFFRRGPAGDEVAPMSLRTWP